jgi:hypothetical protein
MPLGFQSLIDERTNPSSVRSAHVQWACRWGRAAPTELGIDFQGMRLTVNIALLTELVSILTKGIATLCFPSFCYIASFLSKNILG